MGKGDVIKVDTSQYTWDLTKKELWKILCHTQEELT